MTPTCPNCHTVYNLAGDRAKPGARLRCTVCKHVFVLPDPDAPQQQQSGADLRTAPASSSAPAETPELSISLGNEKKTKTGKPGRKVGKVFLFLFLLVLAGFALWRWTGLLDPYKGMVLEKLGRAPAVDEGEQLKEMVHLLTVRNMRQYVVNNEKIGKLIVIEGKVVNEFDEPRELIRIEATLYDSQGTPIVTKDQLAGTMVTLFQLQVLSEEELEQALKNRWDIVNNNTNIPPGGGVPFMVIFYSPPEGATDFNIKVVGAQKSEALH